MATENNEVWKDKLMQARNSETLERWLNNEPAIQTFSIFDVKKANPSKQFHSPLKKDGKGKR